LTRAKGDQLHIQLLCFFYYTLMTESHLKVFI